MSEQLAKQEPEGKYRITAEQYQKAGKTALALDEIGQEIASVDHTPRTDAAAKAQGFANVWGPSKQERAQWKQGITREDVSDMVQVQDVVDEAYAENTARNLVDNKSAA